jgi:hypothetical protein
MALEFDQKNVLIVDGTTGSLILRCETYCFSRFNCPRHYFKRNRPNGQGRGCETCHCCELCSRYSVRHWDIRARLPQLFPRYPNVYGIDMPSRGELVAYGRDTEAVAEVIGADLVIFQDLEDLESAVRQFNPNISQFDCSVFNGRYLTGGVDEEYLQHIEKLRSDNVRDKLYGNATLVVDTTSTISAANGDAKEVVATIANSPVNNHPDETVGLHNSYNSN